MSRHATLFLFALLLLPALHGASWTRGSAVLLEATGETRITLPGSGEVIESFGEAVYFPAVFSCRTSAGGSIFLSTSNGLNLAFRGPGIFSSERYEGLLAEEAIAAGQLDDTNSRIILSLRRGELVVDSRSLSEDGKLTIETPFGQISCVRSVFMIRIDHDPRSRIYDFVISTQEGDLRLRDRRGEVYSILAGQRISGAGSYFSPAIEIAEQTDRIRETLRSFLSRVDGLNRSQIDRNALKSHLTRMAYEVERPSPPRRYGFSGEDEAPRRPRVIEFVPGAQPITPFRGEIKQPDESKADLF